MKTTIVLAHPWHGSFNKVIMDTIIKTLESKQKPYQIIDLNKDGFNPVMREEDLRGFSRGEFADPLVGKYQAILKETDELVLLFPIWWFDMPAILKGFLDKVMLKNFAYEDGKLAMRGLLTHIKSTKIITTSEAPTWFLKYGAGNMIKSTLVRGTLRAIGVKNVQWINSDRTASGSNEKRTKFLEKIANAFR